MTIRRQDRNHKFYSVGLSDMDGYIEVAGEKYDAMTLSSIIDHVGDTGVCTCLQTSFLQQQHHTEQTIS